MIIYRWLLLSDFYSSIVIPHIFMRYWPLIDFYFIVRDLYSSKDGAYLFELKNQCLNLSFCDFLGFTGLLLLNDLDRAFDRTNL